jgi:hypothetical protein
MDLDCTQIDESSYTGFHRLLCQTFRSLGIYGAELCQRIDLTLDQNVNTGCQMNDCVNAIQRFGPVSAVVNITDNNIVPTGNTNTNAAERTPYPMSRSLDVCHKRSANETIGTGDKNQSAISFYETGRDIEIYLRLALFSFSRIDCRQFSICEMLQWRW